MDTCGARSRVPLQGAAYTVASPSRQPRPPKARLPGPSASHTSPCASHTTLLQRSHAHAPPLLAPSPDPGTPRRRLRARPARRARLGPTRRPPGRAAGPDRKPPQRHGPGLRGPIRRMRRGLLPWCRGPHRQLRAAVRPDSRQRPDRDRGHRRLGHHFPRRPRGAGADAGPPGRHQARLVPRRPRPQRLLLYPCLPPDPGDPVLAHQPRPGPARRPPRAFRARHLLRHHPGQPGLCLARRRTRHHPRRRRPTGSDPHPLPPDPAIWKARRRPG